MRTHFERLLGRFSEGEESTGDDDSSDVPLVVRARKGKAKAVVRDEDEDVGDGDDDADVGQRQPQQAGSSKDEQASKATWLQWSSSHRAIYSPFVYAPDLIAPAHPLGVYAPGTVPEQPGQPGHPPHSTDPDNEDESEEEEEDLMPTETNDEALEVELDAEARLDAADARAAAVYEAGVWGELRGAQYVGVPLRRLRKRRRAGTEAEIAGGDTEVFPMVLRSRTKRRKNGEWLPVVEGAEMLKSPDGVKVKSAAMIDDSDSEYLD